MRIISSGDSVPWFDGRLDGQGRPIDRGFRASTVQVGNGLINAGKVIQYDTQLSFAKFALNDTHQFSRYQKVDITNNGDKPVTYTWALEPAAGIQSMYQFNEDNIQPTKFELLEPLEMIPKVSFPGGTFKLQPGKTKTAQYVRLSILTFTSSCGEYPN